MQTNDDELSAHRVRSNRWPAASSDPSAALKVAVDEIFTETNGDGD